ncbi:hypothetical protein BJ742DRAFT_814827 [Cladochytrium replicatum]|nr:hypothetical protein BJ742DRAFT_814827 [Cladochytrium replicatum]
MAKSKSNGKVATATAGLKKNPIEKKGESKEAKNAVQVQNQAKKQKIASSTQLKAPVKKDLKSAKSTASAAQQKGSGRKRKLPEAEEAEVTQQLEEEGSDDGIEVTYEGFNEESDDEKTAGEDQNDEEGSDGDVDEIPVPDDSDSEDDAPDANDEVEHTADEFLANLPTILLPGGNAAEKPRRSGRIAGLKSGVICLSRIPHGFYEQEMKQYFSQFGDVTRLRLSRNKKTGASKHYAFIEFAAEEVAKIASETMNNYLLFNHILKCRFVPAEEVHPNTFVGANRKFKAIPWRKIHVERQNKPKSEEQEKAIMKRLKKKDELTRKKLADAGIDYEFVGYGGQNDDGSKEGITMDVDEEPSVQSRKIGTKKDRTSFTKESETETTDDSASKKKPSGKKSTEVEKKEAIANKTDPPKTKSKSENGDKKTQQKQVKSNAPKVAPSVPPKKKQKK